MNVALFLISSQNAFSHSWTNGREQSAPSPLSKVESKNRSKTYEPATTR